MPTPPRPPAQQQSESPSATDSRHTWRVRDLIHNYLILRGSELRADEAKKVVPAIHLEANLDRWLSSPFSSRRLREMYEVTSGAWMDGLLLHAPVTRNQIRRGLSDAFRNKILVAVLDGPPRLKSGSPSGAANALRMDSTPVPLLESPRTPEKKSPEPSSEQPKAPHPKKKLSLPPVIFDAHMHIMSGNCTPFPVAYYTQIEPVLGRKVSPTASRKVVNTAGKIVGKYFVPFLGWSPRSTLEIGEDTVAQNNKLPSVFRHAKSTPELHDCKDSFLGISIVLTMDMDLCHLDGYKGQEFYTEQRPPGAKKSVYTFNTRLTGKVNERLDVRTVHASEWGLFENWDYQLLNTKIAATEHPLRLIPMLHYEPRRFSQWTGQESSFEEASLRDRDELDWFGPFQELATETQAGMFAGFKMYTSQGYQPTDPNVPSLRKFFGLCEAMDIPIMTHCTPAGHFTHDRRLYIELDPVAKSQLSQADQDAYSAADTARVKYLDAQEAFTKAEKTFDDYCQQQNLLLAPFVLESNGTPDPNMSDVLKNDPVFRELYVKNKEAFATRKEARKDYKSAARTVRTHEDMEERYKRAKGDLQKMLQDPPLRLKYFKEKYLHPEAWRPLLERHPNLRLCLAHFASDACLWWHYLQDENARCWDLDDVPYDKNWVTSIVELCKKYDNFYTDISYLPLMDPLRITPGRSKELKKWHKQRAKEGTLPLHWQGLAKACENKHMLTRIMFGTDWYMILASSKRYKEWHKDSLEGLKKIEEHLEKKHEEQQRDKPEEKRAKYRKINLFYQFAVVNPMRFYRMPLIVDNLKAGIEAYVDNNPLTEKQKEELFAHTKQRMERNYPLLKKLGVVLQQVESASGDDKGLLYTDMVRFEDQASAS